MSENISEWFHEDRYRLFISNIKDYGLFLIDPDGIIRTWNLGAEILKGYSAKEIIGQSFTKFYTDADNDRQHPQYELEIARTQGRYEEEGWRVRKDGTRFWANVILTRLNDEQGKLIGYAKVTRDLSERRLAEEALRESEERFRLMISSVKDYAIIMLDPNGIITSWNEGAARLKGYTADEIIGQHFSCFYDAEEVAVGKCEYELRETIKTGRFEDEGWRIRKDGTKFWANVIITALLDSHRNLKGFSKVTRDVTERKRAEDKLKMAQEGLEARVAERTEALQKAVESRDEFLSIASHELRTPLTALKLHYQIFERQMKTVQTGDPNYQRAIAMAEMAARQVTQLIRLVDDMLDVSRISTGTLPMQNVRFNISDLVLYAAESYRSQFDEQSIPLMIEVEKDIQFEGDAHRIEQVISNLLSNALKYGNQAPVSICAKRVANNFEIAVEDLGRGIKAADQGRIFKRFERAVAASEVSGLGLGLFICHQIIENHGGRIELRSEFEKGSTFTVILPLSN